MMKKTITLILLLLIAGCSLFEAEEPVTMQTTPNEVEVKEVIREPILKKNLSFTLLQSETKILRIDGKDYTIKLLYAKEDNAKVRVNDKEYIGITTRSNIQFAGNAFLRLNGIREITSTDSRDRVKFYLEYNRKTIRDEVREGDTATYTLNGKEITIKPLVITETEKVLFEINGKRITGLEEDEEFYGKDFVITPTSFIINEGGEIRVERSAEFTVLVYG